MKWFLSLFAALILITTIIGVLPYIISGSLTAVIIVLSSLGFMLYFVIKQLIRPILQSSMLRNGSPQFFTISEKEKSASVFSKTRTKTHIKYLFKDDGEETGDLQYQYEFKGTTPLSGDKALVLTSRTGSSRRFFPVECFFHHTGFHPADLAGDGHRAETALFFGDSPNRPSKLKTSVIGLLTGLGKSLAVVIALFAAVYLLLSTR